MDASATREACAKLIEAARDLESAPVADGAWGPDLVLAHVIVVNRLIAQMAARGLAGERPALDNRASQSVPYLRAIVRAAGDWNGLLETVHRSNEELAGILEEIGPEHAGTIIPTHIEADGRVVFDQPMPLGQLAAVPGAQHTPGHRADLESLRARRT